MDAPGRKRVGVALFLSVALAVAAGLADFGAPAFEHETQVSLHAFEDAVDGEEGAAHSVTHGEPFTVDRRQAVAVQVVRAQASGWAGVLVALVPQGNTDADVRDVQLELLDGEEIVRAHLSDVAPDVYRLRIEGAADAASAPEVVAIRVTGGRRTLWPLLLAGVLVWAPAVYSLARRGKATGAVPTAPVS